jgi:nucleotidyltransferase/DNA polymerase involved in DNA repair
MKNKKTRKLEDLYSVGPATVRDLKLLGITRVEQLAGRDARNLYDRLCKLTGKRCDPCTMDILSAAIAQAQDPNLPREKSRWWYWSRVRKSPKR